MTNIPTFILIEQLNQTDKDIEVMRQWWNHHLLPYYNDFETELESRKLEPFIEYDNYGNQIANQVIGYSDNRPIWVEN